MSTSSECATAIDLAIQKIGMGYTRSWVEKAISKGIVADDFDTRQIPQPALAISCTDAVVALAALQKVLPEGSFERAAATDDFTSLGRLAFWLQKHPPYAKKVHRALRRGATIRASAVQRIRGRLHKVMFGRRSMQRSLPNPKVNQA